MVLQRASSYGAWQQHQLLTRLLLPRQQRLALLRYLQPQSPLQQLAAAAPAALHPLAAQAVLQPAWLACRALLHYFHHCWLLLLLLVLLHHLLQQLAGALVAALPLAAQEGL
jgi:hypothetical protein